MSDLNSFPNEYVGIIKELHGDAVVLTRLRELGLIPGEKIRIAGRAPFGEPLLVEVRGAVVALRKKEAQCVQV